MYNSFKEMIAEYTDIDPETLDRNTDIRTDLGMDSLQLANLASRLEDEYGVTISDRDATNIRTIGDILDIIGE